MNISEISEILHEEWIEFSCNKMLDTFCIWQKKSQDDQAEKNISELGPSQFSEKFSYGIKENSCFDSINFDTLTEKTLIAERYGGIGIGVNGGGVRCGNIDNIQLKGIGTNCLVGDTNDYVHSYGGLDAFNAIAEVIYTNVLNKVLPLGVINIHGLIFTGNDTAYDATTKRSCWGVIMVREACVRPAHLLPSPKYKPYSKYKNQLISDFARTRNTNKALAKSFENHNQFIMFLGKYLANCANQFAFARATRIMHSTLSPSNISIDGRWLDLPLSSFLSGGENYGLSTVFYNEPALALNYAIEILHNYSKYNGIFLNPAPLVNYYNEQFISYYRYHLGFVLALPVENIIITHEEEWHKIADIFSKVIISGRQILRRRAIPDPNDPVIALLLALFLSTSDEAIAMPYFLKAGLRSADVDEIICAFKKVVLCGYDFENTRYTDINQYISCVALSALKRSALAGFYYLSEVEREVRYLCENKTPHDVASFINIYDSTAEWIFEKNILNDIVLFKSDRMRITYSINSAHFELLKTDTQSITMKFHTYEQLIKYIDTFDNDIFFIHNFNFKDFLRQLNSILPIISQKCMM